MSPWRLTMLVGVTVSLLGYAALAGVVFRRRNGVMWTALQVTVLGEAVRTGAWLFRIFLAPQGYQNPDVNMFVILISQLASALAVWVLAVHMRRDHHHQGGKP